MTGNKNSRGITLLLAVVLAMAPGSGALAAEAKKGPTVEELLLRIEALEKALEEVRRGASAPAEQSIGNEARPAAAPVETRPYPARPVEAAPVAVPRTGAAAEVAASPDPASRWSVEPFADSGDAGFATDSPEKLKAKTGFKNGFYLETADEEYKLRIGAHLEADGRFFLDDSSDDQDDEFRMRRARIDLRGKIGERFDYNLMTDFEGGDVSLNDAYIDFEFAPWLELRAGKFKTPFGVERLQRARGLPVAERALSDNLVPNRDLGVRLSGAFPDDRYRWALALVNGVPDGNSEDGDFNDAFDVVARVFARPWSDNMFSPLRGAGLGLAATYGREQGSNSEDGLPTFETSGGSDFLIYRDDGPDVIADGDRVRVSPQAIWYEGSFGLLSEYVLSSQQVSRDDVRGWVSNEAWQVRASWVLTGEKASMDGVVPDAPFDFGGGHWGAWEVALRWSAIDVDGEVFKKEFAFADESARSADAIAAAVRWYLHRHVSVFLHYEHTMFRGGAEGGNRGAENLFINRVQLEF